MSLTLLAAVAATIPFTAARPQNLTVADFHIALAAAAQLSGTPPVPEGAATQRELPNGDWGSGSVDGEGQITIVVNTPQIAKDLDTIDPERLMAVVIVVLHHEMHHAQGWGGTGEGDGWATGPASQPACEHVAIYVKDLKAACQQAQTAADNQEFAAYYELCDLRDDDKEDFEEDGWLANILDACQEAQAATPPAYVPPNASLELPASLPGCEACDGN